MRVCVQGAGVDAVPVSRNGIQRAEEGNWG